MFVIWFGVSWLCLLFSASPSILLDQVEVTFMMTGSINYIPSSGGVAIPGYSLTIGYDKHSWIGVQFQTPTSTNNYDTLIVQRTTTPSSGVYTASVKDYYVSAGRRSTLMKDLVTNMDQVITTTSDTSAFSLTLPRPTADTGGEDWSSTQLEQVCFFTSNEIFNETAWSQQYYECYGFQISSYVSTFRGAQLGTMQVQGVKSIIYGGLYSGTSLTFQLFWYRPSASMSNTSSLFIRLGGSISSNVGYDFYQCGVGDYFGADPSSLRVDLQYSGYEDSTCSYFVSGSSVMLLFEREAYTYDAFDYQMSESMEVCVIGVSTSCQTVVLKSLIPVLTISSALTVGQSYIGIAAWVMMLLGLVTLF